MARLDSFYKGALVWEPQDTIHYQLPEIVYEQTSPPKKAVPNILQPQTFNDYIGQSEAKDLAQIMISAANKERRSLPNILIVGEYGLGKTSLGKLLLSAVGESDRLYDGTSVNRITPEPGTFIIDEIHNLNPEVADGLNIHLDNETHHIIGCTNKPGLLPSAFRSRFRTLQLKPYSPQELHTIIDNIANRKKVNFDVDAMALLAERSRFNARQATNYLSMVFDMIIVGNHKKIDLSIVNSMFSKWGVDEMGLLPRDRDYLAALKTDKPVGLQYLAARTGMDASTIEEEVEPYLMRLGLVDRGPRGRIRV